MTQIQQIDQDFVKVEKIVKKFNLLHAVPTILRELATSDDGKECSLFCSLKGYRLTAYVCFLKNGELCSARVIKPARVEDKIRLENINCK